MGVRHVTNTSYVFFFQYRTLQLECGFKKKIFKSIKPHDLGPWPVNYLLAIKKIVKKEFFL